MVPELHAERSPGIEVVGRGDGTSLAVVTADRPVLGESRSTLDRRLVDTLGSQDVVSAAIGDDSAFLGGARGRIVRPEALHDVVLDQWALGPAVDAQVGVAVRVVGARKRDGTSGAGVPALACDEVALVASPGDCVLATSLVGVGDVALAIGPEAVVVAIVRASRRWCARTPGELGRTAVCDVRGSSESGNGRSREKERLGK